MKISLSCLRYFCGRRLGAVLALAFLPWFAHAASVAYTYDVLGRLTKATYSNGMVITYVYDAAGNRTSTVVTGAL